ncbi:MAG: S41 family peptidase [Candidatus Krumholzibacteria bacterium]|nr:S41 family peptidase [Candidatus Krumholzibacteria bacterium]
MYRRRPASPAALSFALLLAAGCAAPGGRTGPATAEAPADTLTAEQVRLNVESLDYVWNRIGESLWPGALEKAGWDGARDELLPSIERARTMEEARAVLRSLIDRLALSHFAIIPGEYYEYLAGPDGGEGEAGITVRVAGGIPLVTEVAAGSPAGDAGVRPGWEVVSTGGEAVGDLIERIAAQYEEHVVRDYIRAAVIQWQFEGGIGDTVEAVFLDGDGAERPLRIRLGPARGGECGIGHLQGIHVWIDTMTVGGDIGYVAFNSFMDPPRLMGVFGAAVESWTRAAGVIVDLRGNGGGIGAMAQGMAGWFIGEKGASLGTLRLRETELRMIVHPRPGAYGGPVAVLVDGLSISAAEFLSGGLQQAGRARVFGTRTPGIALPSVLERVPNGDVLQFVIGDFTTADGRRLEGEGVVPDEPVEPTREALLSGRDPVLNAAIDWIRSQDETRQ